MTTFQHDDYAAGLDAANREITHVLQEMAANGCGHGVHPPPPPHSPPTPPPPAPRLKIVAVEQTQGTQFLLWNNQQGSNAAPDNSVPLVAHKATALRVYVNPVATATPPSTAITGLLSYGPPGTNPWTNRPIQVQPINGTIAAKPASAIFRGNVNDTLNFLIPAAACVGTLDCYLAVWDPAHDPNSGTPSTTQALTLSFEPVPPVRVHGVLVHYTGNDTNGLPTNIAAPRAIDLVNSLAWVGRVYPIGGFNFTGWQILDFHGDLTLPGAGCGAGWGQLFNTLFRLRVASSNQDVYVGLLPNGVPTGSTTGCGGSGVAVAYIGSGPTFAQEIGHAFGRAHAPCGNPPDVDPSYPTYDSYPSGSIGEFGVDTTNFAITNPTTTFDFMTYCGPNWISPYTFVGLKNGIISNNGAGADMRPGNRDVVEEQLSLNYRVHRDGHIELFPSFHLVTTKAKRERGAPSDVACDLVSADGSLLASHACEIQNIHQDESDPYLDFQELLPWQPETAKIVIRRSGAVVGEFEVAKEAPTITGVTTRIDKQQSHTLRVEWKSTHPDLPVTHLLRYSHDGGTTWQAVGVDISAQTCDVNLTLLPGGKTSQIQIAGSAGIRTATIESELFAVPTKPVQALILSPLPEESFSVGTLVVLRGVGLSPDFGSDTFAADALWTSNRDGVLGTGYELSVGTMSIGLQKLTLSMPDGVGGEASASVYTRISP